MGQGLYPSWDAQNMISVHLAEKLKLPEQIPG
ncbi:GNAT family N-acetyltransferase [Oribacterium sp. NK2B42]